ncbi:37S ribosomal protein S26, mitochondrial [[Candida] anglica]|uniref:37S ribosomal protein S26, mitochondrial n=1 Tax=[Candida] anglica TaxID=148631 RepID=A0ABP0E6J4_9ASCO
MFKQSARLARLPVGASKRRLHQVPKLIEGEKFAQNGIQGLYTPNGFQKAWLDYQKYLTINLSLNTTGTENELRTPYQILLHTAKQTTEQHTYHFASQAHNNHFCFEQLADKSFASQTKPSRYFMEKLADQDFNTLEEFREEFLLTADSTLGQGWVFLVERPDKSLRILKCNNDGTPYHYTKNQSLDLNGSVDEASYEYLNSLTTKAANGEKDFTLPILGINCWDYAYINDYGVTGKADYLANFWDCINWDVVNKRLFQL